MAHPTVLFCDLVGSTALLSRVGNEINEQIRRRYFSALRSSVRATAGEEVKNLGDGLMVVFRSSPDDALAAAEAMHRSVARLATDLDEALAIRVGIASGEALWVDGDWFGPAVNIAARLCALASPAQTLATDNVGAAGATSAGALALKGIPEPVDTVIAEWQPSALPPVLAIPDRMALVGRAVELATLTATWHDRGTGRIAVIHGSAGSGKSRLIREFLRAEPLLPASVEARHAGLGDDIASPFCTDIVVFDDLHLVGPGDVGRLLDEYENDRAGRLLIALGRNDEITWIEEFRAAGAFIVDLGQLSTPAVAELLGPYRSLTTAVVATTAGNPGYVLEVRAALEGAPPGSDPATVVEHTCPYRGLVPFRSADAEVFFGREELVAAITGRIEIGAVVGVIGPSGSGKSSLVHAGVLPILRHRGWDIVVVKPGRAQLDELASLHSGSRHGEPVLLVVDQFEELYTLSTADERDAFLAHLMHLVEAGHRAMVSLRADFYGHLADGAAFTQLVVDGHVLVGAMTQSELTAAIERPASLGGYQFEAGLVEAIVNDVAGQSGALPLLSHALRETWLRREGRLLTRSGYRAAGGITGAIALTAERVYNRFSVSEQRLARQALCRLVALGDGIEDTRRRVPRADLPRGLDPVLDVLIDSRLLTIDERDVEISHEALIREWPRLRTWLADDRNDLQTHQHLAESARAWAEHRSDRGELYRGARLANAQSWVDRTDPELSPDERHFLSLSSRRHRQARRVRTGAIASLVVLLVAAVLAAGLAVRARQRADSSAEAARASAARADANAADADASAARADANAAEAEANAERADQERIDAALRRVSFEARTLAAAQPDLGLLLAAEVHQRRPGVEADSALLATLQANSIIDRVIDVGLPDNARLVDIVESPAGILVAATDALAIVIDADSLTPTGVTWPLDGVPTVAVSLDGTEATTVSRTGRVERHDLATGQLIGEPWSVEPGASIGRATPAAYLADNTLAVANGDILEIRPSGAAQPTERIAYGGRIDLLTSDPSGSQLVISANSENGPGGAEILDVRTRSVRPLGTSVTVAEFSSDGQGLYLGSAIPPYPLTLVDPTTGAVLATSAARPSLLLGLSVLDTGEVIGLTATLGTELLAPDLASTTPLEAPTPVFPTGSLPGGRALGFTGSRIVVIDPYGRSNVTSGIGLTGGVAISATTGSIFVTGADGGRLFAASTFAPLGPMIAELSNALSWSIGLSPDGALVAGVTAGQVVVFDTSTGSAVAPPLPAAQNPLPRFSPDGTRLVVRGPTGLDFYSVPGFDLERSIAVDGNFGLAIVWDPAGDSLVYTDVAALGYTVGVESATVEPFVGQWGAFSPDGQRVAAFSFGEATRIIDRATNAETLLTGFRELGFGVFLPDGDRLLRMTLAGSFDIIDLETSSRVGEFFEDTRGPSASVTGPPAVAVDGSYLLLGQPDSEVQRVELSPDRWLELACASAGRNLTRAEWERYFGDIAAYDTTCPQYPAGSEDVL